MPIRMELRSRSGEVLGVTGETYDTIDATLPTVEMNDFPLLSGVDPYGRTMFNGIQLKQLVVELRRLTVDAPRRRAKMLRELIALCEKGTEIVDAELWFLGD